MEEALQPNAVIASGPMGRGCEVGESRPPDIMPEPLAVPAYGAGMRRVRGAKLGGSLMDVDKADRELEDKSRELGRELDGHDVGDDIGNAGDEIRKDLGNTGDDIRKNLGNAGDDLRRGVDDVADDEPFKDQPR
jgi:hypothetical protein